MADYETRDGRVVHTRSGTPGWLIALLVIVALVVAAFAFGLIDIDQTRSAKAPEISVTGGQAPAFDVNTATVDVGTKKETVEVPTIDVTPAKDKK
ncbi:hypothetical protein IP88_01965 [alpha proteobacterium AAP81b]|nr:hypothetical protein IP88_01965 [alpha proteobacterium AAP81b]